jgi:Xaa-Pro aminopeptidase
MAMIKNKKEIACIAEACRITDELFSNIIKKFTYKTELELRDYIVSEIKKRKLLPSFPPIVTSGPRAGDEIHPQSTTNKLRGFVIIDFGVIYKGYMSDMTRTIFVGTPTKRDRTLYARILDTQIRSIDYLVSGVRTSAPDIFARENLGDIAKYFIHTLGHGVGTRIHEAPKLWRKSKHYFRESMVVTVEPGIYISKKLGIRIEDTILVTSDGPLALTQSTKKLLIF